MDLLTKDIAEKLPPLYSQEDNPDPVAPVKFFTPDSTWTWYVIEYDPAEQLFFGLVDGFEMEFGYFSLDELESVKGPWGLSIERDLHWTPTSVSEIQMQKERR